MDDSQGNDNRGERPKNRAQELAQRKKEEHDELMRLLKERVEEVNANGGNLPEFLIKGARTELGRFTLCLEFDPLPTNPADYLLLLKIGVEDNKGAMFGPGPTPVKYRLRLEASEDLSSLLWVGYLGQSGNLARLTSVALVEFALEQLTAYYRRYKPN